MLHLLVNYEQQLMEQVLQYNYMLMFVTLVYHLSQAYHLCHVMRYLRLWLIVVYQIMPQYDQLQNLVNAFFVILVYSLVVILIILLIVYFLK